MQHSSKSSFDNFLHSKTELRPGNAVGLIIQSDDGKYLLQHRDDKAEIFFPNHWCMFGGGIDHKESPTDAAIRETQEELGIIISPDRLSYITTLWFDFSFENAREPYSRIFLAMAISNDEIQQLKLGEGQGMSFLTIEEALTRVQIAPYDAMALWMYHAKNRLTA